MQMGKDDDIDVLLEETNAKQSIVIRWLLNGGDAKPFIIGIHRQLARAGGLITLGR